MADTYAVQTTEPKVRTNGQKAIASTQAIPKSPFAALETKLISLYQRIDALLPSRIPRIVEIVGLQDRQESARLACAFAKVSAIRLSKKTLLVLASPVRGLDEKLSGRHVRGWESAVFEGQPIREVIRRADTSNLSLTAMSNSEHSLSSILATGKLPLILQSLRNEFEMILIEAPTVNESLNGVLLSPLADGVVLVAEAGGTRRQVLRHWIRAVQAQEGTVLGVVLNRRREYIPDFIYKRI